MGRSLVFNIIYRATRQIRFCAGFWDKPSTFLGLKTFNFNIPFYTVLFSFQVRSLKRHVRGSNLTQRLFWYRDMPLENLISIHGYINFPRHIDPSMYAGGGGVFGVKHPLGQFPKNWKGPKIKGKERENCRERGENTEKDKSTTYY
jgi:hypothetical protein